MGRAVELGKIWLLERTDRIGWDEMAACVVEAKDEDSARKTAAGVVGVYPTPQSWLDAKMSTCVEIAPTGKPRLIIQDVQWG